jgi:argininosuccinate lyase
MVSWTRSCSPPIWRTTSSAKECRSVKESAEDQGCSLEDLSDEAFRAAHAGFEPDVRRVFDWEASVEARTTTGGTARAAVEAQLREARRELEDRENPEG